MDPDLSHKDPRGRFLKEAVAVKTPLTRGDPALPLSQPHSSPKGLPPQASAALPSLHDEPTLCLPAHPLWPLHPLYTTYPWAGDSLSSFNFYLSYFYLFICVCACMQSHRCLSEEKGSGDSQPSTMWVLGTKRRSSGKGLYLLLERPLQLRRSFSVSTLEAAPHPLVSPNTDKCQLMSHKGISCCHRVQKSSLGAAISSPCHCLEQPVPVGCLTHSPLVLPWRRRDTSLYMGMMGDEGWASKESA